MPSTFVTAVCTKSKPESEERRSEDLCLIAKMEDELRTGMIGLEREEHQKRNTSNKNMESSIGEGVGVGVGVGRARRHARFTTLTQALLGSQGKTDQGLQRERFALGTLLYPHLCCSLNLSQRLYL